jgi:proline iminopeptidase
MVAPMITGPRHDGPPANECFVDVPRGALFTRSVGAGPPVVVVHGGPGTVDHTYLLPDMDRLAGVCRLVYYDQRGHGRSLGPFRPDDISIDRFVEDLGIVLSAFGLDTVTLLGHSWGTHLALRFAIRSPDRVDRLILMNTFPASSADHARYVEFRRELTAPLADDLAFLRSTNAYEEGDPHVEADVVRLLTSVGITHPANTARLRLQFTRENVVRGRMIFQRFEEDPFSRPFDLLPSLARLALPTLVLHGEDDFVPVSAAEHVAEALSGSRLVVIPECGHCAFLEAMDTVHAEVAAFMRR